MTITADPTSSSARKRHPTGKLTKASDGIPFCSVDPPELSSLRYTRSMYSAQHGLAPWNSASSCGWSEREPWRNGAMIGDVGRPFLNGGEFIPLFNIFQDKEGQLSLPDNFETIKPPFEEWEVHRKPDYFPKGAFITSEGIQTFEASVDDQIYKFRCPVSEGSILILPEGASREDLVVTPELYHYIGRKAEEWFQYRHDYKKDAPEVDAPNGGLFLVTGLDKASQCSVFTTWKKEDNEEEDSVPIIGYDASKSGRWIGDKTPKSYGYGAVALDRNEPGMVSSPFIRGLRIGLSPTTWEEYLPIDIEPFVYSVAATTTALQPSSSPPVPSFVQSSPSLTNPYKSVVFHPAFMIMPMVLTKTPKSQWAKFIVIDDASWMSLLGGRNPNLNTLIDMLSHLLVENKIAYHSNVMYLASNTPEETGQNVGWFRRVINRLFSTKRRKKLDISSTISALRKAVNFVRIS